ncbi:MAG TPA: hypothetical protein VK750_07105 [Cytophagaceae bacterium]|jgi:hypothetical protein|nr:hypothetical protein [Cytophagaceae bacterium]
MITRTLSLLLVAVLFSTLLWNQDTVSEYCDTLYLAADASDVLNRRFEKDSIMEVGKPTFMQVEKINQTELTTQSRVGFFLLRGF